MFHSFLCSRDAYIMSSKLLCSLYTYPLFSTLLIPSHPSRVPDVVQITLVAQQQHWQRLGVVSHPAITRLRPTPGTWSLRWRSGASRPVLADAVQRVTSGRDAGLVSDAVHHDGRVRLHQQLSGCSPRLQALKIQAPRKF